jgi:hypothetical protein
LAIKACHPNQVAGSSKTYDSGNDAPDSAIQLEHGAVATVEPYWYRHVRRIKAALAGKDRNFHKTGQLPPDL